jgi:hypothetical protein
MNGAHAILYSDDAAATRATLAKVRGAGRWTPAAAGWSRPATGRDRCAPGGAGGRVEFYGQGESLREIVAALEAEGRPAKQGGRWHPRTICLPGRASP